MAGNNVRAVRPLCVDLDGSLIKTDTLYEVILKLIKHKFIYIFSLFFWVYKGKAYFKQKISSLVSLSPELLPYDERVLDLIHKKRSEGAQVYLVTGSNSKIAKSVSSYLNLFDDVYCSSESINLTGDAKRNFLVKKFGASNFDYVGNDNVDRKVWESSGTSYVVGSQEFYDRISDDFSDSIFIERTAPTVKDWLKAIRIHQWIKNALIFVPLVLSYKNISFESVLASVLGFFAFSFLASATYIVNDLLDLDSDRAHVKKKYRAFASGLIDAKHGIYACCILLIFSILLLAYLPFTFGLVTFVYLSTTLLYSFYLKTMVVLDTCVLAGLFTIRVIGGTAVIEADWSFWLLAFSMFFFLSLAMTKRASELNSLIAQGKHSAKGRGYIVTDHVFVTSMGVSSGLIGVLVIALYIDSDKVISNYASPGALWLICPLLLYWIGRMWLKTSRGEMNEDPIVFALKDKISHIVALLCLISAFLATTNFG